MRHVADIDIVIVNWNSGKQLASCIQSILDSKSKACHVYVVDNGSTDGSANGLESDVTSGIRTIFTGENLGFGKACNIGAYQGCSEYILFLNPDTLLQPENLTVATAFMAGAASESVGVCGIQLVDQFGKISRSCSRFPTVLRFVMRSSGLDHLLPRFGQRMAEWDHKTSMSVDQVIGAFFLIRRTIFEELKGFDERFFVYFEEVDLSFRARRAGWSSVFLAGTQAFHAGGGTSNQVKAKRLFYSLRSRILYAFKHFSWVGALMVLLATLLLEPVSRSAQAVLRCSFDGLRETWAAYGMLWRWLLQWIFTGVTR